MDCSFYLINLFPEFQISYLHFFPLEFQIPLPILFSPFKKAGLRKDDPIILLLKPAHGLLFADSVFGTNAASPVILVGDAETWPPQHHTEVQAIDTNAWIIFDLQINVFLDPETKVFRI